MKQPVLLIALAVLCSLSILRAEPPPLFSPDPPEPEAAQLVESYLPLLAAGKFEQALALNDLRSMRQYLLDRRLDELKANNPELTAQDIEDMSMELQINELNPARLEDIMRKVMEDSGYTGMTWRIRGYAPAPEEAGSYLVSIDARSAAGQEKPILLGIKKLGEQWLVAPAVIEALMGNKPVVHALPGLPPPPPVAQRIDEFWKLWQAGELNEAYALFDADYRGRVPVLSFLQQAQEVIARIGIPASWILVNCREIGPATLGVGVTVQGSTGSTPSIMIFRKQGETWVLADGLFHPPYAESPPPADSNLPDLRTDLTPSFASPTPAPAPAPPPAAKTPATPRPDNPVEPAVP